MKTLKDKELNIEDDYYIITEADGDKLVIYSKTKNEKFYFRDDLSFKIIDKAVRDFKKILKIRNKKNNENIKK